MGEVALERLVGRQVLEVADVRPDVGPRTGGQGERVLQLGADGQDHLARRQRHRQVQRVGGVAAPAPDDRLAGASRPTHHPGDRVVVAGPDPAVVGQEGVGDPGQPDERLVVVGDQRLVGEVAAGQDERSADRLEEQVMERRVGQEEADPAVAVEDLRGDARARRPSGPRPARSGGRARSSSSTSSGVRRAIARAAARSRTITANGLAQRRLRSRSRGTAAPSVASQARW